jgi:hypothetical protein
MSPLWTVLVTLFDIVTVGALLAETVVLAGIAPGCVKSWIGAPTLAAVALPRFWICRTLPDDVFWFVGVPVSLTNAVVPILKVGVAMKCSVLFPAGVAALIVPERPA